MISPRLTLMSIALAIATLSGCATKDPNRQGKTGAAIGAVAGSVIGHQINSENGRYIGAFIGVLTGAAIGIYMDDQQRDLETQLAAEQRNKNISITRIDAETLRLDVKSEATFDINSDSIRSDFRKNLKAMSAIIEEYDQTAVHVIGHTDSTGTESYNQLLSEKRATSVSRYLSRNGVDRNRLRYVGRGEMQPIDSNETSSGRSRNRRVEIYLKTLVKGREIEAFSSPS